ncbi:hypothetical protein ACN28E_53940 [Archangium lansingense]|uniref:hypothetical protein n=1 Tax=Archangium lansingense TaxID=2995310 RepID=UPI003B7ED0E5
MAIRMRLDTMAGETFLQLEDGAVRQEDGPRLALVTRGEELARLLEGAMACSFSHEVPERLEESAVVERFLRDCSEYSDVHGLPDSLREEMEEHFAQLLDALWRLDWLVFGEARETTLVPGEDPVRGRAVTLCLARYDSPSVQMGARLRRYLESFKEAVVRIEGHSEANEGGASKLLH